MTDFDRLSGVIETAIDSVGIPGVAIGVVAQGEVVFAQGYGVRSRETGLPMSTRTRYPIASTTKAMNATLIAILVEEGVLSWDRPVREYLPDFDLADPAAGRVVTVRDLVTMRTGLPRHEWIWDSGTLSRRTDLAHRFRHLETVGLPRERFLYNNLTVTLAGHVAEIATGIDWEQLVTDRLLTPLGMSETLTEVPDGGDTTSGYFHSPADTLALNTPLAGEVTAPSGGIIRSHISDMAKWVQFNLSGGEVDGQRLLSQAAFDELRVPRILIGEWPGFGATAAYGHGWFIDDVRGERRVSHGGYLDDVDSSVMMFPDRGVGVVCFSNAGPFGVAKPIAQTALELCLGLEPTVSLEDHVSRYRAQRQARLSMLESAAPVPDAPPSHPLGDFAGAFAHPAYGPVAVRVEGSGLVLEFVGLEVTLEHWHYDSWIGVDVDRFGWGEHPFDRTNPITFEVGSDGRVSALAIRFEPMCAPIRFSRT